MKIEIHWPEGTINYRYENITRTNENTLPEDLDDFLSDVMSLSYTYDVIIDNGKVTFVDKE